MELVPKVLGEIARGVAQKDIGLVGADRVNEMAKKGQKHLGGIINGVKPIAIPVAVLLFVVAIDGNRCRAGAGIACREVDLDGDIFSGLIARVPWP